MIGTMIRAFLGVACSCVLIFCILGIAGCGNSRQPGVSYESQIRAAMQIDSPDLRAHELIRLGYQQDSRGSDTLGSRKTLDAAELACAKISDATVRAEKYTMLADAYGRLQATSPSAKALEKATTAAEAIEAPAQKAGALAGVAAIYIVGAQKEAKANVLFEKSAELIGNVEDPLAKAEALKNLGKALLRAERTDRAAETLAQAVEAAMTVPDAKPRSSILVEIGGVQSALPNSEAALTTIETALSAARQVELLYSQAYALAEIGESLIVAKQSERAKKVIEEAQAVSHRIPEPGLQAEVDKKINAVRAKLPKT